MPASHSTRIVPMRNRDGQSRKQLHEIRMSCTVAYLIEYAQHPDVPPQLEGSKIVIEKCLPFIQIKLAQKGRLHRVKPHQVPRGIWPRYTIRSGYAREL